jgi:hypothetical protein
MMKKDWSNVYLSVSISVSRKTVEIGIKKSGLDRCESTKLFLNRQVVYFKDHWIEEFIFLYPRKIAHNYPILNAKFLWSTHNLS